MRKLASKMVLFAAAVMLSGMGCAPQERLEIPQCDCVKGSSEILLLTEKRAESLKAFKANGNCELTFYNDKGSRTEENFSIQMWIDPPSRFRLHGDVAFNPRGIVVASNADEFWMEMKPDQLGNAYYWGKWDESSSEAIRKISPRMILEALGAIELSEKPNWLVTVKDTHVLLTNIGEANQILKRVYLDCCDYRPGRIEYFDRHGNMTIVAEMGDYIAVEEEFFVPGRIVVKSVSKTASDSFTIKINSAKRMEFDMMKRNIFFYRSEPVKFDHVYKLVDGAWVEQEKE